MEGHLLIAIHLLLILHRYHVLHRFASQELTLILDLLLQARTLHIYMQAYQIQLLNLQF